MKYYTTDYSGIISLENLLEAFREFKKGKRFKGDVLEFEQNLMFNLISLHQELLKEEWTHSPYVHFKIKDPKERDIHKALVRDRVLHHALYRKLYPFFDSLFIADSFSCRKNKGTHKALHRFRFFLNKESKNYTKQCFVLKSDIKKFFASIDQEILIALLEKRILDKKLLSLTSKILRSFSSFSLEKGLPLGNLTSQLFVNIYMNEFDHFVKDVLKVHSYVRYADDFVFISPDKNYLISLLPKIHIFLQERLKLTLHPNKVYIKTIYSGVDFLGFVHFPKHTMLRTVTKKRMIKKINHQDVSREVVTSYLGLLSHGNTIKLQKQFFEKYYSLDTKK